MSFILRMFGLPDATDNLRIVITRHGERADFTLGRRWVSKMQKKGVRDPRVPRLSPRQDFNEWNFDSPLTIDGEKQSASVGRKLLRLGYPIDYCYSSPAYRSIQTANKILESQGRKAVQINIEPGLFECPAWYADHGFAFISPEYLAMDRKFNVNPDYSPIYANVDPSEDEVVYYRRSRQLIQEIIRAHKHEGGTVLLSGHGGSIEAVTRGLRGLRHRRGRPEQLIQEALRVDYCNFAILERDAQTREWTIRVPEPVDNPHASNFNLSKQSIIPLHGISTLSIYSPMSARLAPRLRRARKRRQYHHQSPHPYHQPRFPYRY